MIDKICPVCNKRFVVINRGGYLYKRVKKTLKGEHTVYYCGYDCARKDNPEQPFKHSELLHARHI